MRAWLALLAAALAFAAAGCSRTDDASTAPAPMDQPADSSSAPPPPDQTMPPPSEDQTTPPSQEPPPQQ